MRGSTLGRRSVMALLPAAALAACAAPPPLEYRIAPLSGASYPGVRGRIVVRGIAIPDDLDRDYVAAPSGPYQFNRFADAVWAEPLGQMLSDAMVEDLARRLPAATVFSSGGAIGAPADMTIEINVLSFDPDLTGQVILRGQVAIRGGENQVYATRDIAGSVAAGTKDAGGIVMAMSQLWATAADAIAAQLSESGLTAAPPS